MKKPLRKLLRFLESARLAVGLLLFVAAWAILATVVPQSGSSGGGFAWLETQPLLWRAIQLIGLDRAFGAPLFLAVVAVLAISTGLCAWRRTKVAIGRMRLLGAARRRDAESIVADHEIEVVCADPSLDADGALAAAGAALARLGMRTKRRGDVLATVSSPVSVWGSPVFHWGLLAIMLVILLGSLQRSEGLMGVPVGHEAVNTPASYGVLHAGPLHGWGGQQRVIGVDAFQKDYVAGGIDRGPTPKVTVLDTSGHVLKSQFIYANSPLQLGSLTIHPSDWGFAIDVSLLDSSGAVVSTATRLVDISQEASDGTVPLGGLSLTGVGGSGAATIVMTVPVARKDSETVVPANLAAHVVITGADGKTIADEVTPPGGTLALSADGLALRVDNVYYYARLSVVDDGTIPLLYAATVLALLGLGITAASRQVALLVAAKASDGATTVYVSSHLWRNAPTNRDEIRAELAAALGGGSEDVS